MISLFVAKNPTLSGVKVATGRSVQIVFVATNVKCADVVRFVLGALTNAKVAQNGTVPNAIKHFAEAGTLIVREHHIQYCMSVETVAWIGFMIQALGAEENTGLAST